MSKAIRVVYLEMTKTESIDVRFSNIMPTEEQIQEFLGGTYLRRLGEIPGPYTFAKSQKQNISFTGYRKFRDDETMKRIGKFLGKECLVHANNKNATAINPYASWMCWWIAWDTGLRGNALVMER